MGTAIDFSSPKERISSVLVRMVNKFPFYAHLLFKCRIEVLEAQAYEVRSGGSRTACVDPKGNIAVHEEFLKTLSNGELAGVLVHEVMHVALKYFARRQIRDAMVMTIYTNPEAPPGPDGKPVVATSLAALYNLAQDYANNLDIHDVSKQVGEDILALPKGGLLDEKWRGMSSDEIYDAMLEEMKKDPNSSCVMPQWGVGDCIGEGTADADSQDLAEKWTQALIEAAIANEQSKHRGTLPGNVKRIIQEILEPQVHWTDVVSNWLGEHGKQIQHTYQRPHKRSDSLGVFMPGIRRQGHADICVLVDTSGSMMGREAEVLGEVIGIAQDLNMSLRVLVADTKVHGDFHDVGDPEDVEWIGCGGSDFRPAFEYLEAELYAGLLIVFTDGYICVPEEQPHCFAGVLWCIWPKNNDTVPTDRWGSVLKIGSDGYILEKLK